MKWPALTMDRNPTDYTGTLPMGTFLSIPATVDLNALRLETAEGRTLAKAAQEYGMYVVDRTGPRYFLILSETNAPDVPATWNAPLDRDLRRMLSQIQVTTLGRRM
ncbi:MAG: hypothetical protein H0T90_07680 [Gemmatimonadales bacterium]|nr:hypothetical protein [Gemmatimonadales bacterium]